MEGGGWWGLEFEGGWGGVRGVVIMGHSMVIRRVLVGSCGANTGVRANTCATRPLQCRNRRGEPLHDA